MKPDMQKMNYDEILDRFLHLMEDEKVYLDSMMDLSGISLRLGVSSDVLEKCLYDSLGVTCADILNVYRRGVPLYML